MRWRHSAAERICSSALYSLTTYAFSTPWGTRKLALVAQFLLRKIRTPSAGKFSTNNTENTRSYFNSMQCSHSRKKRIDLTLHFSKCSDSKCVSEDVVSYFYPAFVFLLFSHFTMGDPWAALQLQEAGLSTFRSHFAKPPGLLLIWIQLQEKPCKPSTNKQLLDQW